MKFLPTPRLRPPDSGLLGRLGWILGLWGVALGAEIAPNPLDAEPAVIAAFATSTATHGGRDLWSLQPLRRPVLPTVRPGEPWGAIDAFIQQRWPDSAGKPAPAADPRTLIRRLYFDLTGLPPSYAESEAFAARPTPAAYEAMVDRLIASPEFGERQARHWLDVVRYADTCGYERDQDKPSVWKYRDWVIQAFNHDLPYDEFLRWQLAGDELPNRSAASLIATGFLRLGTWNDEPNDPEEYKFERLEEMVHAASTAFLGLTVKCARCHDHKFDPITQVDYHRVAAAFWAGPLDPGPREWLGGPDPKTFAEFGEIFAWSDRSAAPPPLPFLRKGDPKQPGPPVNFGPPTFLAALRDRPVAAPRTEGRPTTTRRTQLADWLLDPQNPLTARVWVNRLWQGHFGTGLVRSPDNFGFTGDRPTHPELLDWLAVELRDGGWKSKRLHKLIVMSQAWQRASEGVSETWSVADPDNRRWVRQNRRRLEAEALRDALLTVSGRLKLEPRGGPPVAPVLAAEALEGFSQKGAAWKASPPAEQSRRSVYLLAKRSLLPPLATVFDFPDTTLPCGRRDVTTVAPQALALMNNAFVHEQSRALAQRVVDVEPSAGDREQIQHAWRFALARDPRPEEIASATRHLAGLRAQNADPDAMPPLVSLCHVLLNLNEFAHVD